MTAAVYTARKKNKFLVLAEEVGGQTAKTNDIQNWPGIKSVAGPKLIQDMRSQVESAGAKILEKKKVVLVKKRENGGFLFEINCEDGEKYFTEVVIIASGKKPRRLNIKGDVEFENKGLTYCPICDAPLFAGKNVAVVGGGNAGLDAAQDLLKYASKIYVLEYAEKLRGDILTQEKLKASGMVEFITGAQMKEVFGDNFVKGLKYSDRADNSEHVLDVEGIFVEIGSTTNVDFAKDMVKINDFGEIEINSKCETSLRGIFAAGDVTATPYKQIVVAASEGAKAALAADEYLNKSEIEK